MTLPDLGTVGVWLLVSSIAAIFLELALAGFWATSLARRSRALNEQLAAQQALVRGDVERLRASFVEMQTLWRPYRRLLRMLRHPLAIALMQSFARRLAG